MYIQYMMYLLVCCYFFVFVLDSDYLRGRLEDWHVGTEFVDSITFVCLCVVIYPTS